MRILIVNGSAKNDGATAALCSYMKGVATEIGSVADIFWLTNEPLLSCTGCNRCKKEGICFKDDTVTKLAKIINQYDGYIFASPVHYAGISGQMKNALTRLFYMAAEKMKYKPAGAICVARRSGALEASGEILRYFLFNSMPICPSNYFTVLYAKDKDHTAKDLEGLQTARVLVKNLLWMIRLIESGKQNGINPPEIENKIKTGFLE